MDSTPYSFQSTGHKHIVQKLVLFTIELPELVFFSNGQLSSLLALQRFNFQCAFAILSR